MSDAERRSILSQVAEGTLSPDEAADRLSALDHEARDRDAHDHTGSGRSSGRTAAGGDRGLPPGAPAARIRIVGSVRMVEITGDPNVKEAVAEGPHDARREGDLLIIEGEGPEVAWSQPGWRWNWKWGDEDADEEERESVGSRRGGDWHVGYKSGVGWSAGRPRTTRVRTGGFPGAVAFAESFTGKGQRRSPALKVRVNPNLPLEVGIKAGAMSVQGVSSPITAEADAASLQIKGFTGPLAATINAGKLEATGRIDEGNSRIECNAGKVDLRLTSGSSVKITAKAELSRINLPGAETRSGGLLGSEHESVVGGGAATLSMEVNVGAANVVLIDEDS